MKTRKILSVVLALAMVLSMMSISAFAAEEANVASIGEYAYTSLQGAINAATEGETITVLTNIELTEGVTVPAGKKITLDLNGKTISMEVTDTITANNQLILNMGDLTIDDSSVEKTGKISYCFNGKADNKYAVVAISNQQGTLTIKNGTIENLSTATGVYIVTIDNLTCGNASDAVVNIEGGVITTSESDSVRGFANSTTNTCTINISGGDITGRVWLQDSSTNANKGKLNITGGEIKALSNYYAIMLYGQGDASGMIVSISGDVVVNGGTYIGSDNTTKAFNAEITDGNFNGGVWICTWADDTSYTYIPAISGGTFSSDVYYCLAEGYEITNNGDGTYVVKEEESIWTSDSDAGFYVVGNEKFGMMRFLFATTYEDNKIISSGIRYFNSSDITQGVTDGKGEVSGNASAFYGDIIDIPENTGGTYYAMAYINIGTEDTPEYIWSKAQACTPDFTKELNYTPVEVGGNK